MNKNELYPCPCCGKRTISELGNYEICSICGWEDDPVQSSEPDFAGGANTLSLIESRKNFLLRSKQVNKKIPVLRRWELFIYLLDRTLELNNQPPLLSGDHHRLPGAEAQRFQPSPLESELRQRVRLALIRPVADPVIMRLRLADGGCGGVLL